MATDDGERDLDPTPASDEPTESADGRPVAEDVAIVIPGYRIVREVSRGGQAVVFLAVQESTGRKVAIRVMREGPFLTPEQRARFDREVQVLAALGHPNIIKIIDRGVADNGSPFLVMNYVEGWTLAEYLKASRTRRPGEPPDAGEMLRLFLKMADAVSAAHLRGIVHRDLKPSNIRIDARGEPHILDFGLARTSGQPLTDEGRPQPVTLTGQFLGSLPWASPEQAEGLPEKIDIRSDVYSLGIILYQMLTGGHFPYEVSGTMHDVLSNILSAVPTSPSDVLQAEAAARTTRRRRFRRRKPIDAVVEAIVLKALAKSPEDRYQSAGDLARDVSNCLARLPTVAAAEAGLRHRRRARRARAAVVTGSAVLVGAAVLLMWSPWPKGDPTPPQPARDTAAEKAVVPSPEPAAPSPGIATAPNALPVMTPGEWIDVLAIVDPRKDLCLGEWRLEAGELTTPGGERLMLPIALRGSYEVAVKFVRTSKKGAVAVILPVGTRHIAAVLSPTAEDMVALMNVSEATPYAKQGLFDSERQYIVHIKVVAERYMVAIEVTVDGEPCIKWRGPQSDIDVPKEYCLPPFGCLGLGTCWYPTAVFQQIQVKMTTGEAEFFRPEFVPPDSSAERPAAPEPIGEWTDLLALVDLERDSTAGSWERRGQAIVVRGVPIGNVTLPVAPQGNYELWLEFVQTHNGRVGASLPVGTTCVNLALGDYGNKASGLELIEEKSALGNTTTVMPGGLVKGRPYAVHVTVEVATNDDVHIEVLLDGKPYISWQGRVRSLAPGGVNRELPPGCLGLDVWHGGAVFERALLKMRSGEMRFLRPPPATPKSNPGG